MSGIPTVQRSNGNGPGSQAGALIGMLAHRILEQWDFADDPEKLISQVEAMCPDIKVDETDERHGVSRTVKDILEVFIRSDIYRTLQSSTIIGREVPFVIPWHIADPQHSALCAQHSISMMEGIIDLVYRFNGDIWIADYKTDRLTSDEIADRAKEYRLQAQIYTEAVFQCVGARPKGFQFVFLRTGTVVPVLCEEAP